MQPEDDGYTSDIQIDNGFSLVNKETKYKYIRNRSKKIEIEDGNIGVVAIKLKFKDMMPNKLLCYGSLPNKPNHILKVFEGNNCHIKFVLWLLSNCIDYKIDNRIDSSKLSVFSLGGSEREMPWLLRALVQLTGRDTHFYGDINKVKCIWHECIRFYDLNNFFDGKTLDALSNSWLSPMEIEKTVSKSKDEQFQ